jgi:adenylate kinase
MGKRETTNPTGAVMRLILLGPPGCGKGTQAHLLSARHQLEHVGTGDLLRDGIKKGTPLGLKAKSFVESGRLVPDDLVNDLIAERFRRPDRPQRFVMDGYPRTVTQALAFDGVLKEQALDLSAALLFQVSDEEIIRRLHGRWSCPNQGCKATYHTETNPPKQPGICDLCGTPLVQRDDDREETVRRRLTVYHQNILALVPHYRARGLLREVPGQGGIEEIYTNIMRVLKTR